MSQPPYAEAGTLDLMRADADQVELARPASPSTTHDEPTLPTATLDVPSDAVDLCGDLHFHLD